MQRPSQVGIVAEAVLKAIEEGEGFVGKLKNAVNVFNPFGDLVQSVRDMASAWVRNDCPALMKAALTFLTGIGGGKVVLKIAKKVKGKTPTKGFVSLSPDEAEDLVRHARPIGSGLKTDAMHGIPPFDRTPS